MELETGKKPTLKEAASELGVIIGRKSVGKPKGNAVWAKIVQISGSDKEIQGTEKCADTKQKSVPRCAIRALACRLHHALEVYILGSGSSMQV
jgi:hypothetical protein